MTNLISPCKYCLVKACCTIKCIEWYLFINIISDKMDSMSSDEIHYFRIKNSTEIINKVYDFHTLNKRFLVINNKS